jgi:hypothetical protein
VKLRLAIRPARRCQDSRSTSHSTTPPLYPAAKVRPDGDLVYLVARYDKPFEPMSGPLGLVVVAVRHHDDTDRAVVAHVTNPQALKALDLEPSPGQPRSA